MCSKYTLFFYGCVEDLAEDRVNMPKAGSDCQLQWTETSLAVAQNCVRLMIAERDDGRKL